MLSRTFYIGLIINGRKVIYNNIKWFFKLSKAYLIWLIQYGYNWSKKVILKDTYKYGIIAAKYIEERF